MKKQIFLITCILALVACEKEIAPENPCDGQQEVKADFVIEELVHERWFEGDSIACCNTVRFRALQKADEYIWILGQDTFRTQEVYLSKFPFGWLDAILIVKSKPNKTCFPFDNGMDTVRKNFLVWRFNVSLFPPTSPQYPSLPIEGVYYGYNRSNPSRYFYVTIKDTFMAVERQQFDSIYVGILNGIPYEITKWNRSFNNSFSLAAYGDGMSPKALSIRAPIGIGKPKPDIPYIPMIDGYAWLSRNDVNTIHIEYKYSDTINPFNRTYKYSDFFIGKRQ
jgi:hypothetical protein